MLIIAHNSWGNSRNRLNFFAKLQSSTMDGEDGQGIYIFYSDEASVGIKTMRRFIGILAERRIPRGIIIWSNAMTAAARKVTLNPGYDMNQK